MGGWSGKFCDSAGGGGGPENVVILRVGGKVRPPQVIAYGWSESKCDSAGGWSTKNSDSAGGWSTKNSDSVGGWSESKCDSVDGWSAKSSVVEYANECANEYAKTSHS